MKVATVFGTRPEIIRLSRIIPKLDELCDHITINTGQNFSPSLSTQFFEDLSLRASDHDLNVRGATVFEQISGIQQGCERIFRDWKPDRILVLGDTNSGLAAFVAKRMGIPVFHMEAGNRCYDDRVPEEVNRRVIDHSSDILMPYTERSRANLLREGIEGARIYVTGNPIFEVIEHYQARIASSDILAKLGLSAKKFMLVTAHRAENVDVPERLTELVGALGHLARTYKVPVIVSTHPRTRDALKRANVLTTEDDVRLLEPFGFLDFITLERNALVVLSDSGTVQEECAIFGVPNVTLRDVTERPETIECGSNILASNDREAIVRATEAVMKNPPSWNAPPEYLMPNVSETVIKIALGYHHHLKGNA